MGSLKFPCNEMSCSKYQPLSQKKVLKETLEIIVGGKVSNSKIITDLEEQNVKPSVASLGFRTDCAD